MRNSRVYFILAVLALSAIGLVTRLYRIQLSDYKKFTDLASAQHRGVYEIQPRRGTIYDSFMEVLAIDVNARSVFADPTMINDPKEVAEALAPVLNLEKEKLEKKLSSERAFVWLSRKVEDQTALEIEGLQLTGVYMMDENRRTYPNEKTASQVLGFAGIDNQGLSGLELYYDNELSGQKGWRHLIRDARRRAVWYDEERTIPAEDGLNVVLTLDSVIQVITEKALEEMVDEFNPETATIVVAEPFTGRILAIANYPSFDPNRFSRYDAELWKNPAVSNVHEPGSVFKVFTASAALEEKVTSPEEKIHCEYGSYRVGGRILSDYYKEGILPFKDVIAASSNIGTVKVAQRLGEDKIYEYMRAFGFGERTGIDLPGEERGILRHPRSWSQSDISTIPIGQGVAVTPIQMAAAVSAVANGGVLLQPYIVDRIVGSDGRIYKSFNPRSKGRIISENTSRQMKEILHRTVTDGSGRRANSKRYDICGKTGTAQIASPEGGYYENRYRASFVGFVPKEHPVLTIIVTAEDPRPVYFGGAVAAPIFKRVAEGSMQYILTTKKGRSAIFTQ